jgi:hypothetical protein
MPETNYRAPDEVLAQTVGADSGWQIDGQGTIYDAHGVFVAKNLTDAAQAMRDLGWFTPRVALATGVLWTDLPDVEQRADDVRSRLVRR